MTNKYVVDTSVVIDRLITKLIKEKKIKGTIIVPNAVVAELEAQANRGQEIGLLGLEELQNVRKIKDKNITIEFTGDRPTETQIKFAKAGEIDAAIREIAFQQKATLITADFVQSESGKAFGLKVIYFPRKKPADKLSIEKYFDNQTMSLHLKEGCFPMGKRGGPGNWKLEKVGKKTLTQQELKDIEKEIVEKSRVDIESFIEISRKGSTVIQQKNLRIVIVKPPVSEGWEITIVRPLKKLTLKDYNLSEKLLTRLKSQARGVVISGEPGSGKSTLAQAISELFVEMGRVTKTIESPRDLQVSKEVTQYSKNFSAQGELHDILFLVRPDNIIFDELRDTPDFQLYTDLRLGGSEMIGVLHAATPIDSVQRFIRRLDTGMIPSVLDTIIYTRAGKVEKVLCLQMLVKVPSGMTESDLARPVVEVLDFETGRLEFEIYSYGEETVVIPVSKDAEKQGMHKLAEETIETEMRKYTSSVEAEILGNNRAAVYVPERDIARIIGQQGRNIETIEKNLGISLDVRELKKEKDENIDFDMEEDPKHIRFYAEPGQHLDLYIDDEFMVTAITSKKGEIKVHKKSELGRTLLKAIQKKRKIELRG